MALIAIGCFDGKQNTSMYSAGGPLTITFDAQAFPASGGPYFVGFKPISVVLRLMVNHQAVTQQTSHQTRQLIGLIMARISSLTSVEINQASGAYGGMTNQIRVNGKILADSINNNVTWSNSLSGLAGSSLIILLMALMATKVVTRTAPWDFLDLSGHTFGLLTLSVKSGGASSFTVNGTTSLSGSGSGAVGVVWYSYR